MRDIHNVKVAPDSEPKKACWTSCISVVYTRRNFLSCAWHI